MFLTCLLHFETCSGAIFPYFCASCQFLGRHVGSAGFGFIMSRMGKTEIVCDLTLQTWKKTRLPYNLMSPNSFCFEVCPQHCRPAETPCPRSVLFGLEKLVFRILLVGVVVCRVHPVTIKVNLV